MKHLAEGKHNAVTTSGNQPFTPVGPFLRRWKLDELPQVLNVLIGDMSLIGPRPKLPEHRVGELVCRPGITGAATLAFAREEVFLVRLPRHLLDNLYQSLVLPAKHNLDAGYMSSATFRSDLRILLDTVLRRWDSSVIEKMLTTHALGLDGADGSVKVFHFAPVNSTPDGEPVTVVIPRDRTSRGPSATERLGKYWTRWTVGIMERASLKKTEGSYQ